MNRRVLSSITMGALVAAGVVAAVMYYQRPTARTTPPPPRADSSEPTTTPQRFRIGREAPDDFAGVLSSSIPDGEIPDSMGGSKAIRSSAESWLRGYASPDSAHILGVMAESGIIAPISWANNSKSESDKRLAMSIAGLRNIDFDPDKTQVIVVRAGQPHPYAGRPKRTGTRDDARPFLAASDARANLVRREILLFGSVSAPNGQPSNVVFGLEFAWDRAASRWVLIQTALYDFPNEVIGNAPLL